MSLQITKFQTRNLWSGILFGIGLVSFFDEAVFHQLLHWHHFYDKSTTSIGLISDGFFHAFSWFATIGSLFLYADLRRQGKLSKARWWGGVLMGGGGFQLYDGTIQHKLMSIHQIRYNVDILPYDVIWNLSALMLIIVGVILLRRKPYQQLSGDGLK
ncbi:DUF2243 domain-containing protein [Bacillus marasmi]|uniref:DUF2243 domain-containing protein n=1 Tax=Bacillus marasmi TaxID=1926279 RepID=UPI0011C7A456|nr:DUF2243 domain-containing protein [Bacillus marasmi]